MKLYHCSVNDREKPNCVFGKCKKVDGLIHLIGHSQYFRLT